MSALVTVNQPLHKRRILPWALVTGGLVLFSLTAVTSILLVKLFWPGAIPARGIQERTLSDGTILVLEKVTLGTEHIFNWERNPSFPGWIMGDRTRHHKASTNTHGDAVVLWFSRRDPATGKFLDFDWWFRSIAIDDRGSTVEENSAERHVFNDRAFSGTYGSRPFRPDSLDNSEVIVTNSQFRPFRSRSGSFKFRVYGDERKIVAEFDVPCTLSTVRAEGNSIRARRPRFVMNRRHLHNRRTAVGPKIGVGKGH